MVHIGRIKLKPIAKEDEEDIVRWRNCKDVTDTLFNNAPLTIEDHRRWFANYLQSDTRKEFMIVKIEDGKKLGTVGLSQLDATHKKAEYGILLGEISEWGKGYAKEATMAILQYAFDTLQLQRVFLRVFSDHQNAIAMYQNLGFQSEGLLRRDIQKENEYKDVLMMAILKEEWKTRR